MIVVFLNSGLGNQMFEYAFAKSLAKKNNEKVVFNLHYMRKDTDGRSFSLKKVGIEEKIRPYVLEFMEYIWFRVKKKICGIRCRNKNVEEKQKYFMKQGIYTNFRESGVFDNFDVEINARRKIKYVQGCFETYKLWEDEFEFVNNLYENIDVSEKIKKTAEQYKNKNTVCIHVRLGDYLSNPRWRKELLICNEKYYVEAQEMMNKYIKNPCYLVFTNSESDMKWIEKNIKFKYEVKYMVGNSDVEDLYLMSCCNNFIISNSTFSWWAQFLSKEKNKKVIAPSKWVNNMDASGIYMDFWDVVNVD